MPGRKAVPTQLKVLTGNPGRRPLNDREPKPKGEPRKPKFLKERAAEIWDEYAPTLTTIGVLTRVDSTMFAAWCCLAAEFEADPSGMNAARISQMRALASSFAELCSKHTRAAGQARAQAGTQKASWPRRLLAAIGAAGLLWGSLDKTAEAGLQPQDITGDFLFIEEKEARMGPIGLVFSDEPVGHGRDRLALLHFEVIENTYDNGQRYGGSLTFEKTSFFRCKRANMVICRQTVVGKDNKAMMAENMPILSENSQSGIMLDNSRHMNICCSNQLAMDRHLLGGRSADVTNRDAEVNNRNVFMHAEITFNSRLDSEPRALLYSEHAIGRNGGISGSASFIESPDQRNGADENQARLDRGPKRLPPSEFSRSRTGFSRTVLGYQVIAFAFLAFGLAAACGFALGRAFDDRYRNRKLLALVIAFALFGAGLSSIGRVGYLFLCDTGVVCEWNDQPDSYYSPMNIPDSPSAISSSDGVSGIFVGG